MDDVLDNTADVAMAFRVVVGSKLGGGFIESCNIAPKLLISCFYEIADGDDGCQRTRMGLEDASATLPLIANDPTHCGGVVGEQRWKLCRQSSIAALGCKSRCDVSLGVKRSGHVLAQIPTSKSRATSSPIALRTQSRLITIEETRKLVR